MSEQTYTVLVLRTEEIRLKVSAASGQAAVTKVKKIVGEGAYPKKSIERVKLTLEGVW